MGAQVVDQVIPQLKNLVPDLPDAFWAEFRAEVKPAELLERTVPIYVKHYSLGELEALVAFYKSPLGQKVTAETPLIMAECWPIAKKWGEELGERAARKAATVRGKEPSKK